MLDKSDICYLKPAKYNYDEDEYKKLEEYVFEYITFFYKYGNQHLKKSVIWPYHCIEDTKGHNVAGELQECLERWVNGKRGRTLKYHNKGRNNLVEMYSSFSSDKPISADKTRDLKKFAYGKGSITLHQDSEGHNSY